MQRLSPEYRERFCSSECLLARTRAPYVLSNTKRKSHHVLLKEGAVHKGCYPSLRLFTQFCRSRSAPCNNSVTFEFTVIANCILVPFMNNAELTCRGLLILSEVGNGCR